MENIGGIEHTGETGEPPPQKNLDIAYHNWQPGDAEIRSRGPSRDGKWKITKKNYLAFIVEKSRYIVLNIAKSNK